VIYGLIDPRTDELRYVGKAICMEKRLGKHLAAAKAKGRKTKVASWIKNLLNESLRPEMLVIEITNLDGWVEAEQFNIAYFRSIGAKLLNATDGGEGLLGHRHSEETRRKIGDASKGKPRPPHVIAAVVATHLGRFKSPETKAKMSAAWTEERKAAHVERCRKRGVSQAQRDKQSLVMKGRKRSLEAIEKGAEKLRGRKQSVERKAKCGVAIALSWTPARRVAQAERMRAARKTYLRKS
jgi:hypothetical protein